MTRDPMRHTLCALREEAALVDGDDESAWDSMHLTDRGYAALCASRRAATVALARAERMAWELMTGTPYRKGGAHA